MVKVSDTLGKRLLQARSASGMTQGELAEAVGITQPSYSALERDISKSTSKIGSLARLLGVDAYWLETGEGAMRRSGLSEALTDYALPPETRRILHSLGKMTERKRKALLELIATSD